MSDPVTDELPVETETPASAEVATDAAREAAISILGITPEEAERLIG